MEDADELTRCYDSLLGDLKLLGNDTSQLHVACTREFTFRQQEQHMDVRSVSPERHREMRRYTIAIPTYVLCRRTIRGWTWPRRAGEALDRSHILELTADIVALANDLASLEKDSWTAQDGTEPLYLNYVLRLERERGDLGAAIDESIASYKDQLTAFHDLKSALRPGPGTAAGQAVTGYLNLLSQVIDGNISALMHMAPQRYPGSLPYLRQLQALHDIILNRQHAR